MATQIQIVNKVLKRLREDSVGASTDNAYAGLIAEFVSDIHEEVQRTKAWEACKNSVVVPVVADQKTYILSRLIGDGGGVDTFENRLCTTQSDLQMDSINMPLAYYYKDTNQTIGYHMYLINAKERVRREAIIDRQQVVQPYEFSITQDADDIYLNLVYLPLITGPLDKFELHFYTPDPLLESDGTTDTVALRIPERPVYLGALMMALNERGEEIGEPGNIAERRYQDALGAAMELDQKHNEKTNEYDWYRG